ncbi:MAG: DUF1926 domain-containing protein [Firmicutes bacterium]|nr:DUF1926 domain-containing protein [Bacillota bacterium]
MYKKQKVNFILALHNHQPEGNFPDVFRQNYKQAYLPFIEELEKHPTIKVVQHYSGILLRWLQENQPEFMIRLRKLTASGQLEMMGGAFYEPILAMIPDEDKIGQIKKHSRFLRENFQVDVQGAWLAERVWEPGFARPLAKAGIQYTVIDDANFKQIGLAEEQLFHYYLTEEEGNRLFIFPINEKMRYLIPFADPKQTISYLKEVATETGDRLVVLADDGEKFGSWPGTAKLVYEQGWLHNFFSLLEENSDWINITTFQEFMKNYRPAGLVYLPAGSYREMMEWSGGYWRNFFTRYPESNHLHKKMLHLREKIKLLPDGPQKREAQEYLWAGQCNCAYWHGIFGGLYLNFLRSALYNRLLKAEGIVDRLLHDNEAWVEIEQKDFDFDGRTEIMVAGPDMGFIVAPAQGGSLLELDYKPKNFNLLDVLTRRQEAYHCNLYELADDVCTAEEEVKTIHHLKRVKEAGLERFLIYDPYRRTSLRDHFYPCGIKINEMPYELEAGDFFDGEYEVIAAAVKESAQVKLARRGTVKLGKKIWPLTIKKVISYQPQTAVIRYDYQIINEGQTSLEIAFAVEFNLNFLAGHAADRYYTAPGQTLQDKYLDSRGCTVNVNRFGIIDEWLGLAAIFRFARPTTVWRLPIETVSQSESGMERAYQGSTILPLWEIKLLPQTPWLLTFTQSITERVKEG